MQELLRLVGLNPYIVNFARWKGAYSRALDLLWMTYENSKVVRLSRRVGQLLHGKPGVYAWKKPQVNVGAMAFDLPAGYTCPGASICHSVADETTGKITDGPCNRFRCFQASIESFSPSARRLRWHNYNLLMEHYKRWSMYSNMVYNMGTLLLNSIPKWVRVVRVHSSGDFFTPAYVQAWIDVAKARPHQVFFGYTKTLYAWQAIQKADLPNFKFAWSLGSIDDDKIPEGTCTARVVFKPHADTVCLDHERDWDDFEAIMAQRPFTLLVHGTQRPKVNALVDLLQMEW